MVQSDATTVSEYLSDLPVDRRAVVAAVRAVILENLPEGYVESMTWGMITYEIPLERYPSTYNGKPLAYAALAAQKNHYAVYLMGVYSDSVQERSLRKDYQLAGKKLDMGKSCIRFKRLDQVPLDVIGRAIGATPVEAYIENYERARGKR